jgi:hypothetical protein
MFLGPKACIVVKNFIRGHRAAYARFQHLETRPPIVAHISISNVPTIANSIAVTDGRISDTVLGFGVHMSVPNSSC